MSADILSLANNIANIIYQDLPNGITEVKRKEIAQKIAIELTNKICNDTKNSIHPWFEYELWCEYELMLSKDTRRRIYDILSKFK